MLIKCLQKKPTDVQVEHLGDAYKRTNLKNDSHLTVGKTYLVLGLVMNSHYPNMGRGTWVKVLCDYRHIESYPVVLFEVMDGKVDPEWAVRNRSDGIVDIQPGLMHEEHFAEDFLDGVPQVVKRFKKLYREMEQRASVKASD